MGLTDFSTGVQGGLQALIAQRIKEKMLADSLKQQEFQNARQTQGDARAQQQLEATIEGNDFNRKRQATLDDSLINDRLAGQAQDAKTQAMKSRETWTPGQMVGAQDPAVESWQKANVQVGKEIPGIAPRLYTSPTDKQGTSGAQPDKPAGYLLTPTSAQADKMATQKDHQADNDRQVARDAATEKHWADMLTAQANNANRAAQPRPLSPTAEAGITGKLTTEWTAATKTARDLDRQVALMGTGLAAARRGDLAQGSQAILVTFQKILDPTSVVRESEYMRSAAGQSLMNQIQGAAQRLAQGGAGVSVPELEKFADLAKNAAKAQRVGLGGIRDRIQRNADHYNIPGELIFDSGFSVDGDTPQAQPADTGGAVEDWIRDPKTGKLTKKAGR